MAQCNEFTTHLERFQVVHRSADLSPCKQYRWRLSREWRPAHSCELRSVAWLMLNPSTADAYQDDPTVVRCMKFSARWGYTSMTIVNLFPFRSSSPAECRKWANAFFQETGGLEQFYVRDALVENAMVIADVALRARLHMVACGANVIDDIHYGQMLEEFEGIACRPLYCLGVSNGGYPLHPMARGRARVPDNREPEPFNRK